MEFKIGDKKITDVRKYGLWGRSAMVVQLDSLGNKTLVFGQGERARAFILYLIDKIQGEQRDGKKLEDCENYKILDNYLNGLFAQIELSCSQWAGEYAEHTMKFIQKKIDEAKAEDVANEEEVNALSEAMKIENAMNVIYNKK